uniref:Uncharacterized protein n=1 Tax=Theropithecus gelada TaxID=9565 RepID=A0A8D2G9M2_THEGE
MNFVGRLLGDVAPNFEANTTAGRVHFHDFLGNSWARISMLTMVKSPQKSYLFPSSMIRIGTLPSCWACWIQQRRMKRICLRLLVWCLLLVLIRS